MIIYKYSVDYQRLVLFRCRSQRPHQGLREMGPAVWTLQALFLPTQTDQNQKGLDLWECKITSRVREAVEKQAPATCPQTQQVSRPAAWGQTSLGCDWQASAGAFGAGLWGTYRNLPPLIWYAVGSQGADRKDQSFSLC